MGNSPKARSENIAVKEIKNEVLVYDLLTNKAVCLNETSASVWKYCDGKRTVKEIAEDVSNKLGQPASAELILLALDQLREEKLLDSSGNFENEFSGLSRRQIIRNVGMASMVALPVISSIVRLKPLTRKAHVLGTCVAGLTPLCAGFLGMTITVVSYASTDGSCTGAILGTNNINCTPVIGAQGQDGCITNSVPIVP